MEGSVKFVLEQIAKPVMRRVGALVAGYLAAADVPQDDINAIVHGLTIAGLVVFDLIVSAMYPRKA